MPRLLLSALVIAALATSVARADDTDDDRILYLEPIGEHVGATAHTASTITVSVVHELRLSTFRIRPDELGAAWSTSVDANQPWTRRLTLGISQSARALGTVDRGGGWCHEGGTHRCSAAYGGGFLDARWLAHARRGLLVAALARAGLAGTAPLRPAVRLGVSLRVRPAPRSRLWLVTEPEIQVALGNRDAGNRDTLIAPLWLGADFGDHRAAVYLGTGLRGQTVGFGDKWEVPMMLGGTVAFHPTYLYPIINVGLELGFPRLLGPQNTGNVRHAAAWVSVTL